MNSQCIQDRCNICIPEAQEDPVAVGSHGFFQSKGDADEVEPQHAESVLDLCFRFCEVQKDFFFELRENHVQLV
jgi:hypothetical protein